MSESKSKDCVLIVGDWFVDEHWVFGLHRSSSSSRTGRAHYRALHPVSNEVRAFCGAGRTALFLRLVRDSKGVPLFPSTLGLGFWHRDDTDALKALFDPKSRTHSPYRLTDKVDGSSRPDGIELVNFNDSFLTEDSRGHKEFDFTNRIIRIYRQGEDGGIWYERFDWEPRRRPVHWDPARLTRLTTNINTVLKGKHVSMVIVKDLLKDAVNRQIIRWLAQGLGKKARWYVSSKKWKPDWRGDLRGINLQLFLVPQVAAKEAVLKEPEFSSWLTKAGNPSQEAIREIDKIYDDVGQSCSVVVLPAGFSFLCVSPKDGSSSDEKICVVQPKREAEPMKVEMGGDSILFPALCACMEHVGSKKDMPTLLRHAVECTYDWVTAEGRRVLDPEHWEADPLTWQPKARLLNISTCLEPQEVQGMETNPWASEKGWWHDALNPEGLGVVSVNGRQQLQLWRSMPEVDGYVCCEPTKRTELRRLVKGIKDFSTRPRSHKAALVVAHPGTGKTFLVRQLAHLAGLRYVPFNIAQMNSRSDVLSAFDEIRAKQEEEEGADNKKCLVFFDEINAPVEGGSPVYGSFLSVLEDGTYVRNGQIFHLKPCVWIFAGTEKLERQDRKDKEKKGSDLASRLGMGTLNLNLDDSRQTISENILRLEQVYLGAAHLRREFPDVRRVSELVLRAFRDLPMKNRVRDIKHFVRNFVDIQYSEVKSDNVPKVWPNDKGDSASRGWHEWVEKDKEINAKTHKIEKADIEIVE